MAKGIPLKLAQDRKAHISNVVYDLSLDIPVQVTDSILGEEKVFFDLTEKTLVALDFNAKPENIKKVIINDKEVDPVVRNEHVILSDDYLKQGANEIQITFIAGDQSLNRHDEYLYTLFVPDRASTCFPIFDQPDLKAKFNLSLTVPSEWQAVANASVAKTSNKGSKTTYDFNTSPLISTYLFSFAAGKMEKITRHVNGREMNMYHRETDTVKVNRNVDAIFDWHSKALSWLEEYTGQPYPFEKFDFVLIPSFQYGGMEHPGAILYKSNSLLLDESPTLRQQMGQGQLIAHETAHMWFGDMVTMKWFNDVWLKEVFANFMASKIVNPGFPDINHDLQFLMSHYPAAYDVDRSQGTHPIQQPLENLKNAGTVYGSIIYHKAPVVMHMLEDAMGEEAFKNGLRQYLKQFAFDNASWDDLIAIMAKDADFDIDEWNRSWVKEAGMPSVYFYMKSKGKKTISKFDVYTRVGAKNNSKGWKQDLSLMVGNEDSLYFTPAPLLTDPKALDMKGKQEPNYVFTNGGGLGYGYFQLGSQTKGWLLANVDSLQDPVLRAAVWIDLYESMLRAQIAPEALMDRCVKSIVKEKEALIVSYITDVIKDIFWKFYTEEKQQKVAGQLEGIALNMAINTSSENLKSTFFQMLTSITTTSHGEAILRSFWSHDTEVEGLTLSESDYTNLAYGLAVREVDGYQQILEEQLERISNPDRKTKFKFVMPALSADSAVRNDFFKKLKDPKNRENEDWVLTALSYLHHPLRAETSVQYITPSLELLKEVQLTGDIFFPQRWLSTTLGGHSSVAAQDEVNMFLYAHHNYPAHLKNKILQSSDMLFRAVDVKRKYAE
ncbi:M1 family aminopeptidase [Fulvivirga maritima]|uniref:M1 family metallopeptidase n=1 Tax=Fulvivirga maritima TaxID=2904247 RepID=UPI001F339075|nr:M1 family aminopeptidase [Fulvivirga maritima]UII25204.1 M1 family aminopeptidase [Fulvivirga maritima]